MQTLIEQIKNYCKEYSGVVTAHQEDFNPEDFAGGNIDDAWCHGMTDGQTDACNDILEIIERYVK